MEITKITGLRKECADVKTFTLSKKMRALPGQFVMVWIPEVGEKPFAFCSLPTPSSKNKTKENKDVGKNKIMVQEVGEFTQEFFSLERGDKIGIRGPYGEGFEIYGEKICLIGGGVGIAPLLPLISWKDWEKVTLIWGAKTEKKIIPLQKKLENLEKMGHLEMEKVNLFPCTDDGSIGKEAFPHQLLNEIPTNFDQLYCCGPEIMMKKVLDFSLENDIKAQFSLERYMKCAIGLCGSCCLEPSGKLVCKDGPVFTAQELEGTEFGEYKRDASGEKHYF